MPSIPIQAVSRHWSSDRTPQLVVAVWHAAEQTEQTETGITGSETSKTCLADLSTWNIMKYVLHMCWAPKHAPAGRYELIIINLNLLLGLNLHTAPALTLAGPRNVTSAVRHPAASVDVKRPAWIPIYGGVTSSYHPIFFSDFPWYPPITKHGNGTYTLFICDFPIETPIPNGFPIATFH